MASPIPPLHLSPSHTAQASPTDWGIANFFHMPILPHALLCLITLCPGHCFT